MTRSFVVSNLVGFVFAIGLGVAGMTDANKVIGFLNLAGQWDPSLAFVMGGALAVTIPAYRYYQHHRRPWLGGNCTVPTGGSIDAKLLGGAALFGIGWGLGGYCPGPGIVAATSGAAPALVFVASMAAGMVLYTKVSERFFQPAAGGTVVDDGCQKVSDEELDREDAVPAE